MNLHEIRMLVNLIDEADKLKRLARAQALRYPNIATYIQTALPALDKFRTTIQAGIAVECAIQEPEQNSDGSSGGSQENQENQGTQPTQDEQGQEQNQDEQDGE